MSFDDHDLPVSAINMDRLSICSSYSQCVMALSDKKIFIIMYSNTDGHVLKFLRMCHDTVRPVSDCQYCVQ